jgi:DnaJ-class molecular chaperone
MTQFPLQPHVQGPYARATQAAAFCHARVAYERVMGVVGAPSPAPTALPRTLAEAYATLHLQPGAPQSVVKAAYRALAQANHPDAGGDAQAMKRINAAYAAIQQHSA